MMLYSDQRNKSQVVDFEEKAVTERGCDLALDHRGKQRRNEVPSAESPAS